MSQAGKIAVGVASLVVGGLWAWRAFRHNARDTETHEDVTPAATAKPQTAETDAKQTAKMQVKPVPKQTEKTETEAEAEARLLVEQACSGCPAPCGAHSSIGPDVASTISTAVMQGSVKAYSRHLLVCCGDYAKWPRDVGEGDTDTSVVARLVRTVKELQCQFKHAPVKVAAVHTPGAFSDVCDIIVCPDQIRLVGVTVEQVATLVSDFLIDGKRPQGVTVEPLSQANVIVVCCHKSRDKRCGEAGPLLADQFDAEVAQAGLADQVLVLRSSHVGGHAFAGNVIVYPIGKWYGRVTPCHVKPLLVAACGGDDNMNPLVRGAMLHTAPKVNW